jgi:hypothetical protein
MSESKKSDATLSNGNGLTAAQKKALFEKVDGYSTKEGELVEQIEKLRKEKSVAIQEIEAMLGKGPFAWKGQEVTVTKRGDTYYFRTRGKASVEKIG